MHYLHVKPPWFIIIFVTGVMVNCNRMLTGSGTGRVVDQP